MEPEIILSRWSSTKQDLGPKTVYAAVCPNLEITSLNTLFFGSSESDSENGAEENGEEKEKDKKIENVAKDEAIEWLEHRAKQAFR